MALVFRCETRRDGWGESSGFERKSCRGLGVLARRAEGQGVAFRATTARSTSAERAEVLRLRKEGCSIRAIAAAVFGDTRFRGRVQRILGSGADPIDRADEAADPSLAGLSSMEAIRVLFERRLAVLVSGEVAPSMTELQKLLDVQRRLHSFAEYERLRKLTREPD